jgi:DNA-directed RNA polymerase specialized sigma24 family protein
MALSVKAPHPGSNFDFQIGFPGLSWRLMHAEAGATLPRDFHTTRWTLVCHAQDDSEDGRRALADLCEAYYEPVVVFLRCETRDSDLARDLAHAFFTEMLRGKAIRGADPGKGRFRCYLLGAVKHFLRNHRAAARRQKRGGGARHVSLEDTDTLCLPDFDTLSPDIAFDRQWATTLLGHALETLRKEFAARGKGETFDLLKPWLTGDANHGDQQALAASLGMNPNTLKTEVSRLKKRFRVLVEAEVAGTLPEGGSVREELAALQAALRSG